jgi:hypothetical protein
MGLCHGCGCSSWKTAVQCPFLPRAQVAGKSGGADAVRGHRTAFLRPAIRVGRSLGEGVFQGRAVRADVVDLALDARAGA